SPTRKHRARPASSVRAPTTPRPAERERAGANLCTPRLPSRVRRSGAWGDPVRAVLDVDARPGSVNGDADEVAGVDHVVALLEEAAEVVLDPAAGVLGDDQADTVEFALFGPVTSCRPDRLCGLVGEVQACAVVPPGCAADLHRAKRLVRRGVGRV